MRRNEESLRLVIIIVILCYWVYQNGAKGNTIKKARADKHDEEATSVEESENFTEEQANTDDTETPDLDSDSTLYKRLQEMPLKLGLQLLATKYGISGSLGKAMQGGTHIYDGAKDAVKTMNDFIVDGPGNARYLILGAK